MNKKYSQTHPKLIRKKILKLDKKPSRKSIIKKLDRLFSLKVREIGHCQLQGKDTIRCSTQLQCAHITTRGRKALRWDFNNAICICSGHHIWFTKNPNDWVNIIMKY